MDNTVAIRRFFECLSENDYTKAKGDIGAVKTDLKRLNEMLKDIAGWKTCEKGILELVTYLHKNQTQYLYAKTASVKDAFNKLVDENLKGDTRGTRPLTTQSTKQHSHGQPHQPDRSQRHPNGQAAIRSSNGVNVTGNIPSGGKIQLSPTTMERLSHVQAYADPATGSQLQSQGLQHIATQRHEQELLQKSKEAGQKLRMNNPDIADLSDGNRPTKIAERFSELYDNDWTEAFESLTSPRRTSNRPIGERAAIDTLLAIVKDAYRHCQDAARSQLDDLAQGFADIVVGGPDRQQSRSKSDRGVDATKGREYLVQYRKVHAELALPRITKTFQEAHRGMSGLPQEVKIYSDRAVELCWWMVVQDPPVYMCPTDSPADYDSGLYRAFTQKGARLDYFVWPALRLYDTGGLLIKGVAQCK